MGIMAAVCVCVCVCAVWVCLFAHRWNELQCSPVSSGNFTPSGRIVKVTSGHKFDQKEAFSFVVGHVKMCRVFLSSYFFVCVLCGVCELLVLKTTLLK